MLAKRIIPCLDLCDGRVVKGVQFVNIRDAGDPVLCAERYAAAGADEITLLDITATHEGRGAFLDVIRRAADVVDIPLTAGGGLRSVQEVQAFLDAGADKVSLNSAAVKEPELVDAIAASYGAQALVLAIDARRVNEPPGGLATSDTPSAAQADTSEEPARWQVFTHGGRKGTGLDVVLWAQELERRGAGEILLTSMDRDGTQAGYDLELTLAVSSSVGIPVIASGGVGSLEHLWQGLAVGGADAVLAASIFHDGIYTVQEAKRYLRQRGVRVREGAL